MLFNDDQVTPAGEADVLNADAYLLFYNLRSLTAKVDDHNQSKSQGHWGLHSVASEFRRSHFFFCSRRVHG